jgi:hypothetical protein
VPFEMLSLTEATLTTFTGRVETHGKSKVPAASYRLRFGGPNTLIDLLSPTARKTFYMAEPGQEDLPGVEPTTPLLRSKDIKHWSPETAYEGWTVTFDRTGNDEDNIEQGGAKIDSFTCDLFENPARVEIECRVSTSNIDADGAGWLWSKQQQKVFVMLAAPLTTQTNPDAGAERDPSQLTLDADGNELREPSDARQAADAAFTNRVTNCPTCGPSEFDREEGTATCLGCGWTTREHNDPGAEGMDPNAMRAFPGAVDGGDQQHEAGDHLADDIERNGEEASAKTPGQIRAAKGAATRRARAAVGG